MSDDRAVPPLRVMTCNVRTAAAPQVRNRWPARRDALATVVEAADVDLCGLQEVTPPQLAWLRERFAGYRVDTEGRRGEGGDEHVTWLSRPERVEVERVEPRWFSDTPSVPGSTSWGNRLPRFALLASCRDRRDGHRFLAVVLHLDHLSRRSRARSAEALAGWLDAAATRSWVVVGDFNARPDEAGLRPLWDVGLRDVLAHLPPRGPGAGTFHGFRGGHGGRRLDHVLVSADWDVAGAEVVRDRPGGRLPSDHWPVLAALARRP